MSKAFYRIGIIILSIAAAGCGGSQQPIGAPIAPSQALVGAKRAGGSNYRIVYNFGELPDGSHPFAGLIDVNGTLYGTTKFGGSSYDCGGDNACGTAFSLTTDGKEKVLYSFGSLYRADDGALPVSGLTDIKGTLYGTTPIGGTPSGYGVAYNLTTDGTETVLHNFDVHPDGRGPVASLIDVNGTLYGTTDRGSKTLEMGSGTVFSLATHGRFNSLYSFGGTPDGEHPAASLVDLNGILYGTTSKGGLHDRGSIFSVTMDGAETVVHSFGSGKDGRQPLAALIAVRGTLYGTTKGGGLHGRGTVFSLTPSGVERVLHSFGSGIDGAYPTASLIEMKGLLYGTTSGGGEHSCGTLGGCGTVFSIATGGTEEVLHDFVSATDGTTPRAGLIDVNGTLYGTTEFGGTDNNGTVFALTP